jgi:hypothetical protein
VPVVNPARSLYTIPVDASFMATITIKGDGTQSPYTMRDLMNGAFEKRGGFVDHAGSCNLFEVVESTAINGKITTVTGKFHVDSTPEYPKREEIVTGTFKATIKAGEGQRRDFIDGIEMTVDTPDYMKVLGEKCSYKETIKALESAKKLVTIPASKEVQFKRLLESHAKDIAYGSQSDVCSNWCSDAISNDFSEWCRER